MAWTILMNTSDLHLAKGSRSAGPGITVGRVWSDLPANAMPFDSEQDAAAFIDGEFTAWERNRFGIQPANSQQVVAAPRPSTCPACSGGGELTDDPQVLKCISCGGIFTDAELPITFDQALKFVALHLAMLANAGADGAFFFDLEVFDVILADGKTTNRLHGWADRKTKRVVQWG